MFNPDSISKIFDLIWKTGFLLMDLVFVGFGVLLVRQVRLMADTVIDPMNKTLKTISWAYLFLTIIIFLFLFFFF